MDGELFWNICDFWEEESTRDGARGGHGTGGAPQGGRRALDSPGHPVRRLTLFFCRKKANFMRKIWAKDSTQSDLRISGYKRNGERAAEENAETERDRETDPISEGLSPLRHHGGHGPEGKPSSHLGGGVKEEGGGGSLPLSPSGARTSWGHSS